MSLTPEHPLKPPSSKPWSNAHWRCCASWCKSDPNGSTDDADLGGLKRILLCLRQQAVKSNAKYFTRSAL
jgi:hypothetical protein